VKSRRGSRKQRTRRRLKRLKCWPRRRFNPRTCRKRGAAEGPKLELLLYKGEAHPIESTTSSNYIEKIKSRSSSSSNE